MIAPLTAVINLKKAKKIKLLAVLSEKRSSVVPNVPTAKESGFAAVLDLFRGLSVPKDTPEDVKSILFKAMNRAAHSKAFMALASKKGFTIETKTPAAFEAKMVKENIKIINIMKSEGIYQSKQK